jgi:hypothetical protein
MAAPGRLASGGPGEEGSGRDIWTILEAQTGVPDSGGDEGKEDAVGT